MSCDVVSGIEIIVILWYRVQENNICYTTSKMSCGVISGIEIILWYRVLENLYTSKTAYLYYTPCTQTLHITGNPTSDHYS